MVAPTLYPEVNGVVNELLRSIKDILGEQLSGMYIFGSLATSDFDQQSDVDILVATQDPISSGQFEQLKSMHARIARMDSWCAIQLEVSYIPLTALRRYDPSNHLHPRLERGTREVLSIVPHDADWVVQRYQVRESGIVVWGPDPKMLIDPVSPGQLREAMYSILNDWMAYLHERPGTIQSRGYQSYLVLTVCRVLYTIASGRVASKRVASDWAKGALDGYWLPLIERAWIGRQSPSDPVDPHELKETFAFIQHALEQSRQLNQPGWEDH